MNVIGFFSISTSARKPGTVRSTHSAKQRRCSVAPISPLCRGAHESSCDARELLRTPAVVAPYLSSRPEYAPFLRHFLPKPREQIYCRSHASTPKRQWTERD